LLAELKESGLEDPEEQKLAELQERVIATNRLFHARSLLEGQHPNQAIDILRQLHADSPTSPAIAQMLLEALLISGQSAAAAEVLANFPEHVAGAAWRQFIEGRIALSQRRTTDALLSLRRAAAEDPQNIRVKLFLGQADLALRRWKDARDAFEAALAIEPEHAEALFGLAVVAVKQGDFDAAVAFATRALSFQELPLAYYHRGYGRMKLGRTSEAAADFEQALRLLPNLAPAKRLLRRLQRG
jgi:tetratricopeptide (TPR) repeat protein